MLDSSNVSQVLKYALPLLITVWSLKYFFSYEAAYANVAEVSRKFKDERQLFIADFLEHEIDGELDGSGLAALCARKKWTPGLILTCAPVPGGVAVVKNAHLNCIRFAIEMGAELVAPSIQKRDDKDLKNLLPSKPPRGEPIDYFFDYGHLNQSLSEYCPQMKLYHSMDDLWDVPEVYTPHAMDLPLLTVPTINGSVIANVTYFSQQISNYADKEAPLDSRRYPVRFNLAVTNWAFPTESDSPSVARNFGRLLRIREDARQVAAVALYTMQKRYKLALDPRTGIKNGKFVGVHLRTEADVEGVFPGFEGQSSFLLDYIAHSKMGVAFLATGAKEQHIAQFTKQAKAINATVVLKKDVLPEGDPIKEVYDQFTWDQRSLVDYEIMLRAGLMAGPAESSFAWNLALRRNGALGASEGKQNLNLSTTVQLPRWDPASSNHLHALVDMGSNGIRFSISDLSPPETRLLRCVYRERAPISLFDALSGSSDPSGLTFPDETIRLVSKTLARFREIAVEDYDVPPSQVMVFATEAMRKAQNATAMLAAIRVEASDLAVHILAPQVETLFGSVGARSGFADVKGLFLDLGGGSVQMTYMDTYSARHCHEDEHEQGYEVTAALSGVSLPFGAARLIKVLENTDGEVRVSEITTLNKGMSEAFERLRSMFPSLANTVSAARQQDDSESTGLDVYLCGGGFRGYGSMLMHNDPVQPYPIPSIGSYTVSGKLFARTRDMIQVNNTFEGKIFGMSKRRRSQFPAIVTVVEALIAAVPRIRSVTFCSGGNREGVLMMKLPRKVRESNPLHQIYDFDGPGATLTHNSVVPRLQAVVDKLLTALPQNLDLGNNATVFTVHLGHLFASQIWEGMGNDSETNAAAALHNAITQYPGLPGLTHLARTVYGLALCARWGEGLGPIDQPLYRNLMSLANASNPDTAFWARYIGTVAAVLARLVPSLPKDEKALDMLVKFHCIAHSAAETGKKKLRISLEISVCDKLIERVKSQNIHDLFKDIGKRSDDKKVIVVISPPF
ncbi:Ppx/GppA phosphatase family-domain-containing protein [Rhypophila decipiens]|uniref:Ppx/GppA phosphatase family-domain-containing protein n=1 Tax=Rhypophila decipiens TaxID=261697 RepID=A0AAN6YLN2_9PEZI|nr:Ppx/GppA phosphatase family-domain-containing protein [Rhypophila decipiens]